MDGLIDWGTVSFTAPSKTKIADIISASALHFRIMESEIKGSCRARHLARARQIVFFLSREMTNASLPQIAREIGHRDHTTVLWGVRKIKKMIADNCEGMADHVKAIRELVLTGNPREAMRAKRYAMLEAAAERAAEDAIAHAERMKQFRRIRDMADAGIVPADTSERTRQ